MIYKIADSYLTNTDPFLNSDDSVYLELRKASTYNSGIVGSFNASASAYEFDVTEDGYYKLFSFSKKVKSTDYVDTEVVTTYEKGDIKEETLFPESYIDVKQTGSPKIYKALVSYAEATLTSTILQNDFNDEYTIDIAMDGDEISITEYGNADIFTDGKTFVFAPPNVIISEAIYLVVNTRFTAGNIKFALYDTSFTISSTPFTNLPILIEVYP